VLRKRRDGGILIRTIVELISALELAGCRFQPNADGVTILAPKARLTDEARAVIRARRGDIAAMLTARTILADAITKADAILAGMRWAGRAAAIRNAARSLAKNVEADLATVIDSRDLVSVESVASQVRLVAKRIIEHSSESVALQRQQGVNLRFD